MKQLSICGKQQQMTYNNFWHETFVHMWQTTANDIQSFSTWNSYHRWQTTANETQASLTWNSFPCGKQQQMTHRHVCHETVIHLWQTTANDTEAFLTWNSCPYVANNSKWHTSMFDMKQLSICGKQQQMTHEHFRHERVIHMWQQQQKTHNHVWHETVIHMWQTTANDTQACFTWNSYPYVANNTKWHTNMFAMKQLSICGKQQHMTHKNFWHETVNHVLFIYLFKIYFTFLISQAVKLTIYTGRKTKIFTYNIRK